MQVLRQAPRWFRQPRVGFATQAIVSAAPKSAAVIAAQTVLLEEKNHELEMEKLLDNDKQREHELAMAALTGGQIRIPEFSRPPTFDSQSHIDFVTSKGWDTIYDTLLRLVEDSPTSNFRGLPYPVVYGITGSGKSTAAWRAITKVREKLPDKKYIPCYLRLDRLEALFPRFETEYSSVNVLATALLACLTNFQVVVHGSLSLTQVGERAIKSYGSANILLHIDEFQSSRAVTRQLVLGCRETIISSTYDFCVVPIVSGIPILDFSIQAGQWPMLDVQLGPLPAEKLWDSFLEAVHVPFGGYENLSTLFNNCGAYASQVVSLAKVIKQEYPQLSGDLTPAEAWNVYDRTLLDIQSVPSWHAVFNSAFGGDRPSWSNTKHIIKRVMLFVLTQKVISEEVVPGIAWERCQLTGIVDLVEKNNGWIVKCSLFALFAMNDIVRVIPPMDRLDHVFGNGWQSHERLALMSFMVCLKVHEAGENVLLQDCRPQGHIQSKAKVEITVPRDTDLIVLAVDGVMLFDGLVDGKPRQILVLSQSKKREATPSLLLMRAAKAKLPGVQNAFVVFDLFTDGKGQADEFVLEADEALIISQGKTLELVWM